MDNRFTACENRTDRRLDGIETDLKEFIRILGDHDKRIQRLEDQKKRPLLPPLRR